MSEVSDSIQGWQSQGSVFYQFISVEKTVSSLLEARDELTLQYELEKLKPSVSSLCRSVGKLPVETTKEQLAQSEIAKKECISHAGSCDNNCFRSRI